MRLIARIPCTFAGTRYLIGDEIPADVVENPEAQAKRGTIAIMNDGEGDAHLSDAVTQVGDVKFTVTIHSDDQEYGVSITESELQTFADIVQMGVKSNEEKAKVTEIISSIESEELLIMIDALDGRKVVKDAIKERVEALTVQTEEESNVEQYVEPEVVTEGNTDVEPTSDTEE